MRSSWIQVGPQSNGWCPYKRRKRGHRHVEGHMQTEAEKGEKQPQGTVAGKGKKWIVP